MIRFKHYREVFLYQVYRTTVDQDGLFRFQTSYDPLPTLAVPKGMVSKCMLGLIEKSCLQFRQDSSGNRDGFEITAAGIEHVEDQLGDDLLPLPGTTLHAALVELPDAAPLAFDASRAAAATQDDGDAERLDDATKTLATAVIVAVTAEYADVLAADNESPRDLPYLAHASVLARAKLLVAPGAPAALLDGLVATALARLNELGVTATHRKGSGDEASTSLLIRSVAVPDAQAPGP